MDLPSRQEILERLAAARTPLDLEDLAARGVVRKVGGRWEVLKANEMPAHWQMHVRDVEQQVKGQAPGLVTYAFRRVRRG